MLNKNEYGDLMNTTDCINALCEQKPIIALSEIRSDSSSLLKIKESIQSKTTLSSLSIDSSQAGEPRIDANAS